MAYDRNVAAVFMQILTDPQAMTEEKANRLVERTIAEEIESVLEAGTEYFKNGGRGKTRFV